MLPPPAAVAITYDG